MVAEALKLFLPDRPLPMRIWRGPFRGARIVMNPRRSLRKMLGLYEHELNAWLELALGRAKRVIDVGANDGYFTFGNAAAFLRLEKTGEIFGFESQAQHVQALRDSIAVQARTQIRFQIINALVGRELREGVTTLDALQVNDRRNTLVKIDVEGRGTGRGCRRALVAGGVEPFRYRGARGKISRTVEADLRRARPKACADQPAFPTADRARGARQEQLVAGDPT
jgi:hypothetical protein